MIRGLWAAGLLSGLIGAAAPLPASELLGGAATADITPPEPAALEGWTILRISQKVDTPLTANVLVLESREGDRSLDAAVMISCDLVVISPEMSQAVLEATRRRLPGFDLKKMFLNATHTHTGPTTSHGVYDIPKTGVMQVDAYCRFAAERIAEAVEKAWTGRKPGSITWGLGHAVVAQNRRAVYADGHAEMYGQTDQPSFRGIEGGEEHDVGTLFFWNRGGKLSAIVVNVSCPAQEAEGLRNINADFWHPVRESLRARYGAGVCVLGWCGAAGDESPHLMYRKAAEERMRTLRKLTRLEELARRIVAAVDEAYEAVKDDRHPNAPLIHKVETLRLPMRLVTEAECAEAHRAIETEKVTHMRKCWAENVVERFEKQKTDPHPVCVTDIHVLRIGDAAVCTSRFELFNDYGVQIKARSKAVQTFVVQLAGEDSYLPTQCAVQGGGYSAMVQSNEVGPEGGQVLVERMVGLINSLWAKPKEKGK